MSYPSPLGNRARSISARKCTPGSAGNDPSVGMLGGLRPVIILDSAHRIGRPFREGCSSPICFGRCRGLQTRQVLRIRVRFWDSHSR